MQEKTYYIILPVTPQNITEAYEFILSSGETIFNKDVNETLEIIPNPNNLMLPCYRFELNESQVNEHRTNLESLNSEFYESSLEYLAAYDLGQGDINPSFT